MPLMIGDPLHAWCCDLPVHTQGWRGAPVLQTSTTQYRTNTRFGKPVTFYRMMQRKVIIEELFLKGSVHCKFELHNVFQ